MTAPEAVFGAGAAKVFDVNRPLQNSTAATATSCAPPRSRRSRPGDSLPSPTRDGQIARASGLFYDLSA